MSHTHISGMKLQYDYTRNCFTMTVNWSGDLRMRPGDSITVDFEKYVPALQVDITEDTTLTWDRFKDEVERYFKLAHPNSYSLDVRKNP